MEKRTFAMIKPDAVACHYTGQIITLIEKAGFRIIAQKMLRLTTSDTNKFYAVHSLPLSAASGKLSDKVKPGMPFMARTATKMPSKKFIFSSAKGKLYRNLTVFLSLKQKSPVE